MRTRTHCFHRCACVALAVCLAGGLPPAGHALGPHEVAVICNASSKGSVRVAEHFVRVRRVPTQNLIRVEVPPAVLEPNPQISPADFARLIWTPATNAIDRAGIGDHILAWVYSTDLPVRVTTSPQMSVTGLTFLRNRVPPAEEIEKGTYKSPLFRGFDPVLGIALDAHTFDFAAACLGDRMPLPSMMLGYTGRRGNSEAEVIACIDRGAKSDGTRPSGTVYMVTNGEDVRSRVREWQFPRVARELRALGVNAVVTNRPPLAAADIAGLTMGAPDIPPFQRARFLPGAAAEHLTSCAAIFDTSAQTKLSFWISAGASVSSGAVIEPFSYWVKFPHARFFVHYASGCAAIESFYMAVQSPLQILPVGDPLAAPWQQRGEVTLAGLPEGPARGRLELRAAAAFPKEFATVRYTLLADGRTLEAGRRDGRFEVDAAALGRGTHTLRVVAYQTGMVRPQAFAEGALVVGGE